MAVVDEKDPETTRTAKRELAEMFKEGTESGEKNTKTSGEELDFERTDTSGKDSSTEWAIFSIDLCRSNVWCRFMEKTLAFRSDHEHW